MKYMDLSGRSQAELYKQARSLRDLLPKREKRLRQAIAKDPTAYSKFGLEKVAEGAEIGRRVRKDMSKHELKILIVQMEEIKNMKTASAEGAKQHNKELLYRTLSLPETGRLNKQQKARLNEGKKYIKEQYEQGVDVLAEFWEGFNIYKKELMYQMKGSEQLVEEYTRKFNVNANLDIQDLHTNVRIWIGEQIANEKKGGLLPPVNRNWGRM